MRILIVSDSYPPEVRSASRLMADLAEGLHAAGHAVVVATTVPAYNLPVGVRAADVPRDETANGVRIVRIATLPHHRVNYLLRGLNQFLLPGIFARGVRAALPGPFDIVIVHSPPLPLALAAANLAREYRARFIANIHDIFPQNGIDLVAWWQKPLIRIAFGRMESRVYARADRIVVPSERHARYLETRRAVPKEKIIVIPHWVDPAPYDAALSPGAWRRAWGLEKTFIFFFGGVLGPSQGLELVLSAAESFRAIPEVRFLFVGDGTARPRLERIARAKGLGNVVWKPFVSEAEYPALLKEMDVGMVTLTARNTTPAVPAKLMGYMAAGVPVVLAVHKESDALRIVREARCGFAAVSDDPVKAVAAFHDAYNARGSLLALGASGRAYAEAHFAKEKIVRAWDELLRVI